MVIGWKRPWSCLFLNIALVLVLPGCQESRPIHLGPRQKSTKPALAASSVKPEPTSSTQPVEGSSPSSLSLGATPASPSQSARPGWAVLNDDDPPAVPQQVYRYTGVTTMQTDKVDEASAVDVSSIAEVEDPGKQQPSSLAYDGPVPSQLELQKVDEFARRAPANVCSSPKALAQYLKGAGPTPIHKLRAIYTWEAYNIEYDPAVRKGGSIHSSQHPPDVLQKKVAVCDGYARLFVVLAQEMGLEAEHIIGEAQSDGHGTVFGGPKTSLHRWVRAKVRNSDTHCWVLIDPTWGRGHLASGGWKFEDRYFMTNPSLFLRGHFPKDNRWQLASPPLSQQGWKSLGSSIQTGKGGSKIKIEIQLEPATNGRRKVTGH